MPHVFPPVAGACGVVYAAPPNAALGNRRLDVKLSMARDRNKYFPPTTPPPPSARLHVSHCPAPRAPRKTSRSPTTCLPSAPCVLSPTGTLYLLTQDAPRANVSTLFPPLPPVPPVDPVDVNRVSRIHILQRSSSREMLRSWWPGSVVARKQIFMSSLVSAKRLPCIPRTI